MALSETDAPPVVGRLLRLPARPPRVDIALAAAFVVMTLAEAAFSPDVARRWSTRSSAAWPWPCWRGAGPRRSLVARLVVAVNIATNPAGEFSTLLSLVLVCFTIGSETGPPRNYVGLLVVLVPFVAVSIAHDLEPSDLAAALVFFVGPWTVGGIVQSRIARTDEAVARAERLERERELEAARAAAEERTRIARELHDIVSHSISVVTIQTQAVAAGSARTTPRRPRPGRRRGDRPRGPGRDAPALRRAPHRGRGGVARPAARTVPARPAGREGGAGDMRVRLTVEGDPVDLPAASTSRRTASPRRA